MSRDPRAEPRYAERVSYVVVNGPPGARLMDLVISPDELIHSKVSLTINYQYYIHKQVRKPSNHPVSLPIMISSVDIVSL